MILLAVETSSSRGSLSLFDTENSQALANSFWLRDRSHSEMIFTRFEELLKTTQISPEDIGSYAIGLGPGSFTGIRVGINFVRTMAYSFNKPVYTVDSLRLLAEEGIKENSSCLCLVNAFRNLIYCAGYGSTENSVENWLKPQALSTTQLDALVNGNTQCLGNGYEAFSTQLSPRLKAMMKPPTDEYLYPKAETLAQLVSNYPDQVTQTEWREVKPLYIRASEAEEKLGRS